MVSWLPAEGDYPPRPDTPILRHLTFTEIHAVELGFYLGLLVVWALTLNESSAAFALVVSAARKIMSRRRMRDEAEDCDHDVGFHDAVAEPQYFGFPVVVIVGVYYAVQLF